MRRPDGHGSVEAVARTPEPQARAAAAAGRRRAAALGGLALLLPAALGVVCAPGQVRVTNRPPDPVLVDARGEPDRAGIDALVAEVEAQRGLGFIQRPTLELAAADDPRLPALRAAARALLPCPRGAPGEEPAAEPAGACFPDPSLEWIVCTAPPDLEAARRALRRLLDAQRYPRLARAAPVVPGDPGVALRALLGASAGGAPARGPSPAAAALEAPGLLELGVVELERQDDPTESCEALAAQFLFLQEDREAPFRRPPLSTRELASPRLYRSGERPRLLTGAPPAVADCAVAGDESVGVARLLVEVLARGGSLPGPALARWQGDRGVRFACAGGAPRWIYVAELSDEAYAAAFAEALPRLLPGEFAGPPEVRTAGRRVVAFSRGLDAVRVRAWAVELASEPLTGVPDLD